MIVTLDPNLRRRSGPSPDTTRNCHLDCGDSLDVTVVNYCDVADEYADDGLAAIWMWLV